MESQEALAAKAGISVSGLKKWLRGEAEPTLGNLVRLASVLNVSVEWLATGRGTAESGKEVVPLPVAQGEEPPPGWVTTPRYQVEVGAGAQRLLESSDVVDWWAFREEWLRRHGMVPGKIAMLEVHGDSMEPTIRSGDLVLLDIAEPVFREGIWVVWWDGFLLKRLRRVDGGVELISDNPLYPASRVPRDRWAELQLVGLVRWHGRPL